MEEILCSQKTSSKIRCECRSNRAMLIRTFLWIQSKPVRYKENSQEEWYSALPISLSLPFPSCKMVNAVDRHFEKLPAAWSESVNLLSPGKTIPSPVEFLSRMYPFGVHGSVTIPFSVEFAAARIQTLCEFWGEKKNFFSICLNSEVKL